MDGEEVVLRLLRGQKVGQYGFLRKPSRRIGQDEGNGRFEIGIWEEGQVLVMAQFWV